MRELDMLLSSWPMCDSLLRHVRVLDAKLAALISERDLAVLEASRTHLKQIDQLNERRKNLVAGIEAIATNLRDDLGKATSRHLDNGRIGWRKTKASVAVLKQGDKWDAVVAKVLAAGKKLAHWIRRVPSLVKNNILDDWRAGKATEATLRQVGLRIEGTDGEAFYVKPDTAPLRDREADGSLAE